MQARTRDGRAFRILKVIDEHTRKCLSIGVARRLTGDDVPEITARAVRGWLDRAGVKTLSIEPGSPWGDGYIESFNGKLGGELLDGEVFDTPLEAGVLIERYRVRYDTVRPHKYHEGGGAVRSADFSR